MNERVEFSEGSSNKFWEVEVSGNEVTTRWGRIGTAGQTRSKTYADGAAALREAQTQLASKLKGGYQQVATVPPRAAMTPVEPPACAAKATATAELLEPSSDWLLKIRHKAYAWRDWGLPHQPLSRPGHMRELKAWKAGLGVVVPSLHAVQRQALALLLGDGQGSEPLVNAAALTIAPEGLYYVVESAGLLGAVQALLRRQELQGHQELNHPCRYRWLGYKVATSYSIAGLDLAPWGKLRNALAGAPQEEYQQVVDWARDAQRSASDAELETRVMLAFLLPDQNWADELIDPVLAQATQQWGQTTLPAYAAALIPSLRKFELVKKLWNFCAPSSKLAPSLIANLGSAAYQLIFPQLSGAEREDWAEPLWEIPDPELAAHFKSILEERSLRARLTEYFLRFPQISIPVLAGVVAHGGKGREVARTLLTQLLRQTPELPSLEARELAVCQQLVRRFPQDQVEARPEQLPPVLARPPWLERGSKARTPRVAQASAIAFEEKIHWGGTRPQGYFYEVPPPHQMANRKTYEKILKETSPISMERLDQLTDELALQLWNELPPKNWGEPWQGLSSILARFELEALPALIRYGEVNLGAAVEVLKLVESPRAAGLMALAMLGLKHRKSARQWLQRYPRAALLGLVPLAVGPACKSREAAEEALRWMASWLGRAEIEKVGVQLKVEEALIEVLDFDPLLLFPVRLPKLPAFIDPGSLPRPILHSGEALPLEPILQMLAFSPLEPPYAGLAQVKEVCRPESLEEMAWEVYSLWHTAGGPAKEKWAFWALAHLGGDETARRLAPLIKAWPQENLFARAEQGLDVLAAIGTDVALMHVYQMSQKLKSKALQEKARLKLDEIAIRRGLTPDELADRLVPDLDLDTPLSGGFLVRFDEYLKPQLLSPEGKPLKALPKGSDELRWKAIKKDAKTIGLAQITRLELAMGQRRRWSAEAFHTFLVQHPLLVHLVRRLLWGVYGDSGLVQLFRVAEDSSLADVEDQLFAFEGEVGLPHPLELSHDQLNKWGQVFADYALIQPFAQLGRPIFRLTEEEKKGCTLTRVVGCKLHPGKVVNLEQVGWRRGETWDGGVCCEMLRPMGKEHTATLEFHDGLYLGALHESGEQTLGQVKTDVELGSLDEILVSELLRDLEGLR